MARISKCALMLILLLFTVNIKSIRANPVLTNEEAARTIIDTWTTPGTYGPPMFSLSFSYLNSVLCPNGAGPRRELIEANEYFLEEYREWQRLGVIRIVTTGPNRFPDYCIFSIRPGTHANLLREVRVQNAVALVFFDAWQYSNQSVIRTEEIRGQGKIFRIVMMTYTAHPHPLALEHARRRGRPTAADRKVRALLEWDDFSSRWICRAQDISAVRDEFSSDNVAAYLRRLR